MTDWTPDLSRSSKPLYLALVDVMAEDIASGKLAEGQQLPPQRKLAEQLDVNYTTVARGYAEAHKRGLVDANVGQGTFVRAPQKSPAKTASHSYVADLSMNLPPEPQDPTLIARMTAGLAEIGRDLVDLLRYQGFGGVPSDKDAAVSWLSRRALVPVRDRILVSPGAHPALTGVFGLLAKPGDTVLSEAITYPGVRAITAQAGLNLVGVAMDDEGILPDALAEACKKYKPKCLYLNPTLQNPTTLTVPEKRRAAIARVLQTFNVPLVEDDAYGFIPVRGPAPFAAIIPELTWHIAGLAKCIGAGLRVAYVIAPTVKYAWSFAAAMRAANVMASPLTVALATRWIEDGTADAILRFIRAETEYRHKLVAEFLPAGSYRADPLSFNLWVPLPKGWTRSTFVGHMRATGIGVVASDAFTVSGPPAEAVRVCLGGPITRNALANGLEYMAHALREVPEMTLAFL
jgi:DNA-binding transcriptional MocR family regulator